MSKEIDHEFTYTVICPYCGKDNGGDDGDGPPSGEQECRECDKKFHCEPNFSVKYSTSKMPCLNGEAPHDFREPYAPWGEKDPRRWHECRTCNKREQTGKANTVTL